MMVGPSDMGRDVLGKRLLVAGEIAGWVLHSLGDRIMSIWMAVRLGSNAVVFSFHADFRNRHLITSTSCICCGLRIRGNVGKVVVVVVKVITWYVSGKPVLLDRGQGGRAPFILAVVVVFGDHRLTVDTICITLLPRVRLGFPIPTQQHVPMVDVLICEFPVLIL